MSRRPIIGVTMRLDIDTNRFYLGRDYTEALEALGATPFHISLIPEKRYLSDIVEIVDGILLPGSDSDVDPLLFGEEPRPRLKKTVPEKDATDLLLLAEAERAAMPVFGICFGMQALNVARGGTLYQDIESEIERCVKHEQGRPLARNSHGIEIEDGSFLSNLAAEAGIKVNSHHHQALKAVGANLRATARASDGVIECVEDTRKDRFAVGVQWHPELSWRSDPLSRKLFESFTAACSAYKERKTCDRTSAQSN